MPEPEWTGLYRCGECGHGKDLTAWAIVLVYGSLGADGHLADAGYDEEDTLFEDSIQCTRHPDAALDMRIDGQWHRWWNCPLCHGRGKVNVGDGYRAYERECPMDGVQQPGGDGKRFVHGYWWPLSEPWPVSTLDRAGHVFTPGVDPYCRHCGVPHGSIAGQEPCDPRREHMGHRCPVIVAEGDSDAAFRVHGSERWFCGQHGTMNGTFTTWRCDLGPGCGLRRGGARRTRSGAGRRAAGCPGYTSSRCSRGWTPTPPGGGRPSRSRRPTRPAVPPAPPWRGRAGQRQPCDTRPVSSSPRKSRSIPVWAANTRPPYTWRSVASRSA